MAVETQSHPSLLTWAPEAPAATALEGMLARQDLRLLPLRPGVALLEDLVALGPLVQTSGGRAARLDQPGPWQTYPDGAGGITLWSGGHARLIALAAGELQPMAVISRCGDLSVRPPSVLLFDRFGSAAHQIEVPDKDHWEGWITLVRRHMGCWNCLRSALARPQPGPSHAPTGAPADPDALASGLLELRRLDRPVQAVVGPGPAQGVATGLLEHLDLVGPLWRVGLAGAVLTLQPDRLATVYPNPFGGFDALEGTGRVALQVHPI